MAHTLASRKAQLVLATRGGEGPGAENVTGKADVKVAGPTSYLWPAHFLVKHLVHRERQRRLFCGVQGVKHRPDLRGNPGTSHQRESTKILDSEGPGRPDKSFLAEN